MTADRARAHENYGIATPDPDGMVRFKVHMTQDERLNWVQKMISDIQQRLENLETGATAQAAADMVAETLKVDPIDPPMPKPLPCPFCGGTPYMSTSRSSHGWETKISCAVDCCPAEPSTLGVNKDSHSASTAIAIERWNKRA